MKTKEFTVYIQPSAKDTEIIGMHNNAIKIRIKSRPSEGEANDELILFLSVKLDIKKSSVKIIRGQKSRVKVIQIIYDETCKAFEDRLNQFFA